MTKHQLWQKRIADWKTSGQTQQAFCKQNGLAVSTFCTWLKKIRHTSSQPSESIAFLPVVVEDQNPCCESISIQTKELNFSLSIPQLAQLIKELKPHA